MSVITKEKNGQWITVKKDGVPQKTWNVLADDYAHTAADRFYDQLSYAESQKLRNVTTPPSVDIPTDPKD